MVRDFAESVLANGLDGLQDGGRFGGGTMIMGKGGG